MDAAMKTLVIAVGVYNVVLWRSFLATVVSGSIWFSGTWAWPKTSVLKLHTFRSAIIAVVLLTFFWGLAKLPLADAIGLSFIAPLLALILAAIFLGERIRIQAIWATLAGVVGVAFILGGQFEHVQYSPEIMQGTLAVLLSTLFYAYNLILARKQAQLAKPTEIMFFQSMLLSIFFLLPAPWLAASLATEHWLPLVGVTALSLSGQFLMSWSYARAEAQYLIPTEYSAFVWAILFGWVFFDEGVVWTTLVGAVLIIVGCLIAARSNSKLSEPIEATI
jgi:S-adenosylmethionine uptake transporter